MQGTIFVEFLSMVEEMFGLDVVDEIIESAKDNLKTKGAYTSIGNYDHSEIFALVTALVKYTGKEADELIAVFGKYLSGSFVRLHPEFFENVDSFADFLISVEGYIHKSVRKIYPDANPPSLPVEKLPDGTLKVVYSSHRPFASLAKQLIIACAEHFETEINIKTVSMSQDGLDAEFSVQLVQ